MSQKKLAGGRGRDPTDGAQGGMHGGSDGGRGQCARAAAARVKGPLVWLDMDQKEIDDAYDQSVWAPNQPHARKRRALWSESVRSRLKPEIVSYGPTETEKLEIYRTKIPNAPIRVFLHGGAWRSGSATQRHLDKLHTPLILAHGTLESPEFQRQTRDFAAAVRAAGKPVQLIVAEGYNHFELPETFGNPYGLMGRAALEQMRLAPA